MNVHAKHTPQVLNVHVKHAPQVLSYTKTLNYSVSAKSNFKLRLPFQFVSQKVVVFEFIY